MAMSMGTTPVDDGGWAFHVDLYDSSPAGGSASVPLRRFFTPRRRSDRDPHKKFRWTDRAHGPNNAPMRNGSESAKPDDRIEDATPIQHNSLQTKGFCDQANSRRQWPATSGQRLPPLNCGFQTEKSQRYDFCQGLPSPGAFWQEKGR